MNERIDPATFYWADDIARIVFGRTTRWFSRHRKRLHAEGFPHPISRIGRPRWSGHTLLAWQNRTTENRADQTTGTADDVPDEAPAAGNLVPWDQVLKERARRLHPSRRGRSESR